MKSVKWIFILMLGLAIFPSKAWAKDMELARFTYSSGWDALPAIVAIERGFFAKEGLVVSGLTAPSADAVVNSLHKGSNEFAAVSQRVFLIMAALELPVKVIAMNGWGTKMDLVVPSGAEGLKTLKDLKGKTIAVGQASEALPVLVRLLNKSKLRPDDVTIKTLSAAELTQVFSGEEKMADAVLESKHFTTVLVKKEKAKVLVSNQDMVQSLGLIGSAPLVVRTSLIKEEPNKVEKFVRAWIHALRYIQEEPEDCARLLMVFFHRQGVQNVSQDLTADWLTMIRYGRYYWSPADVTDAEFNGWGLKEGGFLKVAPKIDPFIDNRFAKSIVKAIDGVNTSPAQKPETRESGRP